MIQLLFLTYVAISSAVAFSNWRLGIYLMLIAGMLQDPVRKLMPGAPGIMVLAFVPIFIALCANLFSRGSSWPRFLSANPWLAPKLSFFGLALMLAFVVLLVNYGLGVWKVAVIGLIGYAFPLIAVAVGYWFAQNVTTLKRLILFYCVATAVLLIGGLLESWNVFPQWRALGTDALGMTWIRHVPGYIVQLTSGFYRSPDLMGWHAALLVMFSLMMTLYSKSPMARMLWVGLVVWGVVIVLISGRNKMIFMPAIFVSTVGVAYLYKGNVARSMTMILTGVLAVGLFWATNTQLQLDEEYIMYVGEGSSTATERVKSHGIVSLWSTYQQSGFFGEGLGSASTGARFGGASGIRTWQESGTSKLLVELGG